MSTPRRALGTTREGSPERRRTDDPDTDKPAIPVLRVARAPVWHAREAVDLKINSLRTNRPVAKNAGTSRDRRVLPRRIATGGRVILHRCMTTDSIFAPYTLTCVKVSARGEGHASVPRRDVASRECRCKARGDPVHPSFMDVRVRPRK